MLPVRRAVRRHPLSLWFRGAWLVAVVAGVACSSGSSPPNEEEEPLTVPTEGQGGDAGADAAGGAAGSKAGSAGKAGSGNGGSAQAGSGQAGSGQAGSGQAGSGQAGGEQAGAGGGAGGMPAAGSFGNPCDSDDACTSKICVETGHSSSSSQVCSQKCSLVDGCPKGSHCATIDMEGPLCIPDRDSYCSVCKGDTDCKNLGDRCVTSMKGDKFCAPDCAFDGKCPTGAECKAPLDAPAGVKVCMPLGGEACPCAPNRDKETRPCTKKTGDAVCMGTETCDGKSSTFVGCDAPTPAPESCDQVDNDCNGKVDDLPGATCSCTGSSCTILCDAGFTHYPADLPDIAGCPCAADSGEPTKGATCATALGLSSLSDVGAKTDLTISGTLSADDDVDWFKVKIDDAAEAAKNSTHVKITFESNPDNEFVFQVIRGEDCSKEAAAPPITSYDFCVDYQEAGPKGMSPCGPATDNVPHCDGNVGSVYLIGVKRSPMAAKKTCTKYSFKVVANAGTCDPATFDACGAAQTSP